MSEAQIHDSDIFTGREVKRLLEAVKGRVGQKARWLGLTEAASILGVKPDTLRRRCARWYGMMHPPVRVRKQNDLPGSHWLLDAEGVWALGRQATTEPAPAPAAGACGTEDEAVESMAAYWCDMVTRDL